MRFHLSTINLHTMSNKMLFSNVGLLIEELTLRGVLKATHKFKFTFKTKIATAILDA
jgi:hypothetical protein